MSPLLQVNHDAPVLIVGAGPTGLVLALWLRRLGVARADHRQGGRPGHDLARAGGARAHAGAVPPARASPTRSSRAGSSSRPSTCGCAGDTPARAAFGDIGRGLSPFPFMRHLSPGRARAAAHRAAGAHGRARSSAAPSCVDFEERRGGVPRRLRGPRRRRARWRGRLPRRLRRRPLARARGRWASASPAAPTSACSTSPTSRCRGPVANQRAARRPRRRRLPGGVSR